MGIPSECHGNIAGISWVLLGELWEYHGYIDVIFFKYCLVMILEDADHGLNMFQLFCECLILMPYQYHGNDLDEERPGTSRRDLTGMSLDWGKSYPKWSDRRLMNYLTEICSLHIGAGHDF